MRRPVDRGVTRRRGASNQEISQGQFGENWSSTEREKETVLHKCKFPLNSFQKCPDSSDYCEKTTVHVEGKDQIVRSCLKQEAKNFREGCNFDKSNVQKCECSGDACNGAEIAKIISPLTATLVSAVLAVMLK